MIKQLVSFSNDKLLVFGSGLFALRDMGSVNVIDIVSDRVGPAKEVVEESLLGHECSLAASDACAYSIYPKNLMVVIRCTMAVLYILITYLV